MNEDIDDSLLRQALTEKSYVAQEKERQKEVGLDAESMEVKANDYLAMEGMSFLQKTIQSILKYEYPLLPQAGIE